MSSLEIITEIPTIQEFQQWLQNNPGLIVIKLGAEWCGPCKKIASVVDTYMHALPQTVQGVILDVDENFEVYAYLQKKRIINGIPAVLCYNKGNTTFLPDDFVIGADIREVELFFHRCIEKYQSSK
jgi:thioredoxin-like negative regulator of GroEL